MTKRKEGWSSFPDFKFSYFPNQKGYNLLKSISFSKIMTIDVECELEEQLVIYPLPISFGMWVWIFFFFQLVMIWESVDRLSGKDRYRPSSLGFISFLEDLGAGHQGTNLTPRLLVHVLLYTDFTDAYVQLQVTCSTDADRT